MLALRVVDIVLYSRDMRRRTAQSWRRKEDGKVEGKWKNLCAFGVYASFFSVIFVIKYSNPKATADERKIRIH